MASPRMRSRRALSATLRLPAAASAEYSPSECPATNLASRPTEKPASVSSTRKVASETAISAGWAFSVSCNISAGPSQMIAVSLSPSAASISSNTARADGKASARPLPMPTIWEPCPGKVNAAVIGAPSSDGAERHSPGPGCQAEPRHLTALIQRALGGSPLETACRLVAADFCSGLRTAHAAHELSRAILAVWLRGGEPQHGDIVRLHFHPAGV